MAKRDDEITFSVEVSALGDTIRPGDVAETIRDSEALLSQIEKNLRGTNESSIHWSWAEDRPIELRAYVNGVDHETLSQIARDAEHGFSSFSEGNEQWPNTFDTVAKNRVRRIVDRWRDAESIRIKAAGEGVTIDPERIPLLRGHVPTRSANKRLRCRSSIEGVMDVVSVRGRLRASVTEHGTRNVVKCTVTDDLFEDIKNVLKHRVILEGTVTYREDGTAVSIADITSISERKKSRPLHEFIGAAPGITGGMDSAEFIARLRGDD